MAGIDSTGGGRIYLIANTRHDLRTRSVNRHRRFLLDFGLFLRVRRLELARISQRHLLDWVSDLRQRSTIARSINERLRTGRRFCEWLGHSRGLVKNPFATLGLLKVPERLPSVLDRMEMKRLICSTTNRRDRAILEIFYGTGCRLGELVNLNIGDVSIPRRSIACRGCYPRDRILPFNRSTEKALRRYLPQRLKLRTSHEALFLNPRRGRLGYSGTKEVVARAGRRAGILRSIGPDIIRNSFATHFLDRNGRDATLRYLLGQKSFKATTRFASVASGRLRSLYDRVHPRA